VVIAIDGPAASGKGTLARRLARRFGLAHLDTGLLYRATVARLLHDGGDPTKEALAVAAASRLEIADLEAPELRDEEITRWASVVAAQRAVRLALLDFQRDFAMLPPGGAGGAVLDGRDIGTVVLPDADIKLFVTASAEVRAERRFRELRDRGVGSIRSLVLHEIRERDERDRHREVAPLKRAEDAFLLDTTDMSASVAFDAACQLVISRPVKTARKG